MSWSKYQEWLLELRGYQLLILSGVAQALILSDILEGKVEAWLIYGACIVPAVFMSFHLEAEAPIPLLRAIGSAAHLLLAIPAIACAMLQGYTWWHIAVLVFVMVPGASFAVSVFVLRSRESTERKSANTGTAEPSEPTSPSNKPIE